MSSNRETIAILREALRASPDNLPLIKHLAALLLAEDEASEAEALLRDALTRHPDDVEVRLRLARVFAHQNKDSAALVILEDLAALPHPPAEAFRLMATLFLRGEDLERARAAYRALLRIDGSQADAAFEAQLGLERLPAGDAAADEDAPDTLYVERPRLSFADVGGMNDLKEEIRLKIIHPLNHPELYRAYGKAVGGGLLLYGPPGCGKTYLARATAGEVQATFITVGLHDVLDMYIGESERNLHQVFELARHNAPCVLFFDEVDALGANRSDMRRSAGRQLINQFLSELDGATSSNEGVLILAATNAPWHLDPALRRPGRFDRILFVPPPDADARVAILTVMLAGKPVDDIQYRKVAARTDGFSGADLKAVVEQAIESKLQDAIRTGVPSPITTRTLLSIAGTLKPTTREWFSTARNYALYANQSGLYDDILAYMKKR